MYFVGIAGGSGSGKTTFARKILEEVQSTKGINPSEVALLTQDHYYVESLPDHLKHEQRGNYDHPEALDWNLIRQHFEILKADGSVEVPVYDYKKSQRTQDTFTLGPVKALIVEGIFGLWDEQIRNLYDLRVYVDVAADIRFIRRLHRDINERQRSVESVVGQYYATVRPMHREFIQPTQQFADMIIGEENSISASVVAAKVKDAILGLKQ